MSGFSADWLRLREPLDARSRDASLAAEMTALLRPGQPQGMSGHPAKRIPACRQVIDLGAGTGANLRFCAPLLGGRQDWLLVEQDALLLAAQAARLREWAAASDAELVPVGGAEESGWMPGIGRGLVARGERFECSVRSVRLDLSAQLGELTIPEGALICASALLDLVSADWLRRLVSRAAQAAAGVWFALSYDGRVECEPREPEDERVLQLFNAHQRTDKGFGPALGPEAAAMAERLFMEQGYRTLSRRSDWCIGSDEREPQRVLIDGWFEAARDIGGETAALRNWLARRREHVRAGRSRLRVGHVDMAGRPPSLAR